MKLYNVSWEVQPLLFHLIRSNIQHLSIVVLTLVLFFFFECELQIMIRVHDLLPRVMNMYANYLGKNEEIRKQE